MFSGTSVEKVIPNKYNAKDMGYMFDESTAKVIDVSSLNTSMTTDISRIFRKTNAEVIFGLNNFDTRNVLTMRESFRETNARDINIESFITPKLKSTQRMFFRSNSKVIRFGKGFVSDNLEDVKYMFNSSKVEDLVGLSKMNLTNIDSNEEILEHTLESDGSRQNIFYGSNYDFEYMNYWSEILKGGGSLNITGEHNIIRKGSGKQVGPESPVIPSPETPFFHADEFEARHNRVSGWIGLVKEQNVSGLGSGKVNPTIDIHIPKNTNTSGRIRSVDKQGYGSYSADIIIPDNDRLLNGFFLYGYTDGNPYEIDIEILKHDNVWQVWATVFNPTHPNYKEIHAQLRREGYSEPGAVFHKKTILKEDPTKAFNNYKINFEENNISFELNDEEFARWDNSFDYEPMYLYMGTFYTHWLNRDIYKANLTDEEVRYLRSNGFGAYSKDGLAEKMNSLFGSDKYHKMTIKNIRK